MSADYNILFQVGEAIASQQDLSSLWPTVRQLLQTLSRCQIIHIILCEPSGRVSALAPDSQRRHHSHLTLKDGPGDWVWHHQMPRFISFDEFRRDFPLSAANWDLVYDNAVCSSGLLLPLTTARRRLGLVEFWSAEPKTFSPDEAALLARVVSQVAVAVENALNYDARGRSEKKLQTLLDVTNAVVTKLSFQELLEEISRTVRQYLGLDASCIMLPDPQTGRQRFWAVHLPIGRFEPLETIDLADDSPWSRTFRSGSPVSLDRADFERLSRRSPTLRRALEHGVHAGCSVPLISHGRPLGVLFAGLQDVEDFPAEATALLMEVAGQLSIAVDNALAYEQISLLKDRLIREKLYLEDELRAEHNFHDIIGQSRSLRSALDLVERVAPSDATVLILGETGTGKELIARAIHHASPRRNRTLVKLNCAAIPSGLLESELFGHERGAFTGAIAQKIGRLELAHEGTLFLDEVGDIPLELQSKLLRALQEREFERVGSSRTTQVDVRLIAATNRNLREMVERQQFRSDLYYRLNVFPISIPPLRERREDIPLLATHLMRKHARKLRRPIETIAPETLDELSRLPWPGNVRELENVIERAIILTDGPILRLPIIELHPADHPTAPSTASFTAASFSPGYSPALSPATSSGNSTSPISALTPVCDHLSPADLAERRRILDAWLDCNGIVDGPRGVAARLGLVRSTLYRKMKRLALDRSSFRLR